MMPPVHKPDSVKVQGSPKISLSQSAGSGTLLREFSDHANVKLSNSCFGAIRTTKDDDLTSLNWLQNRDILKGFDVSNTVPPMSPPHEGDGDFADLLLRGANVNGDSSPEPCSNRKKSPSKPPYSFSSLIFMAIEESSGKRLPVKDIYSWIMEHFPYFRDAPLGWKNSVRHNLSLNKCFKKVDKERGQNVGKGSLWTVDPDYRTNLVQALRKTPAFHPYQHLLTTPPPSPQNGGSTSSTPRSSLYNTRTSGLDDKIHGDTLEDDLDAEAEAVATICWMSKPAEVRAAEIVRCRSCPPSESDKEDLIKQEIYKHYYRHRSSFSGAPTMIKDRISSLATEHGRRQGGKKRGLSSSFSKFESKLNRSDVSVDSALGLEQDSDSEDEDSEIDEAMEKVVKRELNDSGYGQDFKEQGDQKRRRKEVTSTQGRKGRTNSTDEKLSDYAGADALLKLANSASFPVQSESPSSDEGSPVAMATPSDTG